MIRFNFFMCCANVRNQKPKKPLRNLSYDLTIGDLFCTNAAYYSMATFKNNSVNFTVKPYFANICRGLGTDKTSVEDRLSMKYN